MATVRLDAVTKKFDEVTAVEDHVFPPLKRLRWRMANRWRQAQQTRAFRRARCSRTVSRTAS